MEFSGGPKRQSLQGAEVWHHEQVVCVDDFEVVCIDDFDNYHSNVTVARLLTCEIFSCGLANTRKYMDAKGIKWNPQVCTPGGSAGPFAVLCLSPIKVVAFIGQAVLAALIA